MVRAKTVRRHVSFAAMSLPGVDLTPTGGALREVKEDLDWWWVLKGKDHVKSGKRVLAWALGILVAAALLWGVWLLLKRHPEHWWALLLPLWGVAIGCNERVANVSCVLVGGALALGFAAVFGVMIAVSAPFVFLAEAPIWATATFVAAALVAIFFGGGG